jgi:hypothetical protein
MTEVDPAKSDPQAFLNALVDGVSSALPDAISTGIVTVDRKRSMGDRLSGRPGTIAGLQLSRVHETLTLRYESGPRWLPEAAVVSGGVVISRRRLALGEWLTLFAGRIASLAADNAGDAAASAHALQTLGVQQAGADIRVDDSTIARDLRALPARLRGRVPGEAVASVARIGDLLVDALPRVAGKGEAETVVRRTATIYLPDTLRAYLSLPGDWVVDHVFPDGTSPQQAFIAQLSVIESGAARMRDAAVADDVSELLINGRFLTDRFAGSSLDLP